MSRRDFYLGASEGGSWAKRVLNVWRVVAERIFLRSDSADFVSGCVWGFMMEGYRVIVVKFIIVLLRILLTVAMLSILTLLTQLQHHKN